MTLRRNVGSSRSVLASSRACRAPGGRGRDEVLRIFRAAPRDTSSHSPGQPSQTSRPKVGPFVGSFRGRRTRELIVVDAGAAGALWRAVRALPMFRRLLALRMVSQFADGLFQAGLAGGLLFNPERGDPWAIAGSFAVPSCPIRCSAVRRCPVGPLGSPLGVAGGQRGPTAAGGRGGRAVRRRRTGHPATVRCAAGQRVRPVRGLRACRLRCPTSSRAPRWSR